MTGGRVLVVFERKSAALRACAGSAFLRAPVKALLRAFLPAAACAIALASPAPALAGSFTINWDNLAYPPGNLNPPAFTLVDQFGFQVDMVLGLVNANGSFTIGEDTANLGGINDIFFGNDAPAGSGGFGESRATATLSLVYAGTATPLAVNGLNFLVTDIDPSDGNNNTAGSTDRCDFVSLSGNGGAPTLAYLNGAPTGNGANTTFLIGPSTGPGASGTGANYRTVFNANPPGGAAGDATTNLNFSATQAHCLFYVNTGFTSPASANNSAGSLLATFPSGTSVATIEYDEVVENAKNNNLGDPASRGVGIWGGGGFTVDNTISLAKSTVSTSYTAAAQVITYSFVVTNNGPLPINTGQNISIQDSRIGTFTCGTISAAIPSGGTHSCTANYTVLAADILAANIANDAIAGAGTGAQSFATRLQSNTAQVILPNHAPKVRVQKISLGGTGTFAFSGSTNLVATPASIATVTAGTAAPASPAATNASVVGTAVTITETAVAGYGLTGFSCTDANSGVTGNPASFGTFVSATRVGTIPAANVRARADITCVFTNSRPRVSVQKITVGGTTSVTFSAVTNLASVPGGIATATPGVAAPVSPASINVTNVGTAVTVTEAAVSGYTLAGFTCTDANAASTGNPASFGTFVAATRIGTIPATNVRAGANIACTFTNTRTATVRVQKISQGGTGTFAFSAATNLASTPASIATATAGTAAPAAPAAINITTNGTAVTITETAVAGYALTGFTCTDANSAVTGNTGGIGSFVSATRVATIPAANVVAGADFTCIFTNTRPIVRVQKISLGGTATFAFSGSTNLASTPASILTASPGVSAPLSPTATNATTVGTAVTITESPVAGYALTGFSCTDANSASTGNPASFGSFVAATRVGTVPAANVIAGADIRCTFTNTKTPTVKVQKTTLGAFGGPFSFAQTNLASAPGGITTTAAGTPQPAAPTPINVTTIGTAVTLTETVASGYFISGGSCTDASAAITGNSGSIGTLGGTVLTIPAANVLVGAEFTCVFTNTLANPQIRVTKIASATGFTTGDIQMAPAGTVVTYTYVVTNTGNQTLTAVSLSDISNGSGPSPTPLGESLTNDVVPLGNSSDATLNNGIWSTLAVGDSATFTGTYTITQSDVDILQ